MKQLLPYLICFFCGLILYIIYQLRKVKILAYISKWKWGMRIVQNEYFKTMFKRAKNRARDKGRAVEMAKLKNQAENLKQYVVETSHDKYWIGTMREWNIEKRKYPKVMGKWLPTIAVFQTR